MSISDKVLDVIKSARQATNVDDFKFQLTQQGTNFFVSVGNVNYFAFDNSADCAMWVSSLNLATSGHLFALRKFYDKKVQDGLA